MVKSINPNRHLTKRGVPEDADELRFFIDLSQRLVQRERLEHHRKNRE